MKNFLRKALVSRATGCVAGVIGQTWDRNGQVLLRVAYGDGNIEILTLKQIEMEFEWLDGLRASAAPVVALPALPDNVVRFVPRTACVVPTVAGPTGGVA